jgi:hypothetical protein
VLLAQILHKVDQMHERKSEAEECWDLPSLWLYASIWSLLSSFLTPVTSFRISTGGTLQCYLLHPFVSNACYASQHNCRKLEKYFLIFYLSCSLVSYRKLPLPIYP